MSEPQIHSVTRDDILSLFAERGVDSIPDLCVVPTNILTVGADDVLVYTTSALDLKARAKEKSLDCPLLTANGDTIPFIEERDSALTLGTIYFSAMWLIDNPLVLPVLANVISDYISDRFRSEVGAKRVKLSLIVEKTPKSSWVSLSYDGPPENCPKIDKLVKDSLK